METLLKDPLATPDEISMYGLDNIAAGIDSVSSHYGWRPTAPSAWAPITLDEAPARSRCQNSRVLRAARPGGAARAVSAVTWRPARRPPLPSVGTPAANLHLTVRFVGAVERSVVDGVADRLDGRQLRGFDLELGELGTFTRGRLVRVAWLAASRGAEPARSSPPCSSAECVRAGLEPERRPFQPHLTLARARRREGIAAARPSGPARAAAMARGRGCAVQQPPGPRRLGVRAGEAPAAGHQIDATPASAHSRSCSGRPPLTPTAPSTTFPPRLMRTEPRPGTIGTRTRRSSR